MPSILDGVSLSATHRAEGYDPAVVEGDYSLEKEISVAAGHVLVEMHMTNWAKTQREDPVLNAVLDQLEAKKKTEESMPLVWMADWFGEIARIL